MGIDIRLPIGLMFTLFGLLLSVFGFFSDRSIYTRSLGINMNVEWGGVLLVFGLLMLFLGRRGSDAGNGGRAKRHGSSGASAGRSNA